MCYNQKLVFLLKCMYRQNRIGLAQLNHVTKKRKGTSLLSEIIATIKVITSTAATDVEKKKKYKWLASKWPARRKYKRSSIHFNQAQIDVIQLSLYVHQNINLNKCYRKRQLNVFVTSSRTANIQGLSAADMLVRKYRTSNGFLSKI